MNSSRISVRRFSGGEKRRPEMRLLFACPRANLPLLDRRFEGANGVDRQPLKKVFFFFTLNRQKF